MTLPGILEGLQELAQAIAGARLVVSFEVPGKVEPKERARTDFRGSGRIYTPAKTVGYERTVATVARFAIGPRPMAEGPVLLDFLEILAVPPSWPKWKRALAFAGAIEPTGKPDLDNLEKAAKDALNGIAWRDDALVTRKISRKAYGDRPGLYVRVYELAAASGEAVAA